MVAEEFWGKYRICRMISQKNPQILNSDQAMENVEITGSEFL